LAVLLCAIADALWAQATPPQFYGSGIVSLALPDGRRLIGGASQTQFDNGPPYGTYTFAVKRLNSNGNADLSFGGTGLVVTPIWGDYEFVDALLLQPDGKIIVGGNAADPAAYSDQCYPAFCGYYPALVRLNDDGTIDQSFNGTGKLILAIGYANQGEVGDFGTLTGLALEGDGRIIVLSDGTAVARVNADGTLDRTFVGTSQVAHEYPVATVVEYYNRSLDHYFMTLRVDEIYSLDSGAIIKGWKRTGKVLSTYARPWTNTSPVCRFYIPPPLGDSHFFGRDEKECAATGSANPEFVLEDQASMHMVLPVDGTCPEGIVPVYRIFNNRRDANHRYTTDRSVRDQMVAEGGIAEGDGPDRVVMCSPP
jgi:uncharacterized delta-60 repeat protein